MATAPERPKTDQRRTKSALLALGLLLIGLNLRIGVASIGPVLGDIRNDLGITDTAASLLTTIPVVAFGAFAFLTPGLTRRFGLHRLLGAAMVALVAGLLLRLYPDLAALFAGTVVVGAAIAIANVAMPAAIKRDFSHRAGLMMGLYSTTLFIGAALASGLTSPLLPVVGGEWRVALGLWAIPAVLAVLLWTPQFRNHRPEASPDASKSTNAPRFSAILTDPVALAVTVLMGTQSMSYYATLTWIPTLLTDNGMDAHTAGWLLSFSAFPGIAASLFTPTLARTMRPAGLPIVIAVVLTGAGYAGLALAPTAGAYLWMSLLGLGQGASISLALTYIVWRSPDAAHTGHVSTMAQGIGYLFAGLGPLGIGYLHSVSGEWALPIAALGVLLVVQLVAGLLASRDRHVSVRRA
ncbi:CynX/NimT family MFS transporter [Kineosporia succinea]|uniref:CP family cyanate transporter-like MFS transporter n=1 Tax=Kineosporia succinea TaxID=84632 RepID=A0ABT9P0Z6_9ACTN|nr:MFS transporter [Kineosporia succinea]MDP9826359.1 CP family cyanate transporter-like MFS transporter [Kineosporia succinea]